MRRKIHGNHHPTEDAAARRGGFTAAPPPQVVREAAHPIRGNCRALDRAVHARCGRELVSAARNEPRRGLLPPRGPRCRPNEVAEPIPSAEVMGRLGARAMAGDPMDENRHTIKHKS